MHQEMGRGERCEKKKIKRKNSALKKKKGDKKRKINTKHSIDVIQSTNVSAYLKSIKNSLLWLRESAILALMLYN